MSSGATYSPGAWFALVAPTIAVLIDPDLPGPRLDELWRTIQTERSGEAVLDVIRVAGLDGKPPTFALAALGEDGVRLVMRGSMQITVQNEAGHERVLRGSTSPTIWHEQIQPTDVLWLVRPGGRADGVALPIVNGAVLADVLAWQPVVEAQASRGATHGPGSHQWSGVDVSASPSAHDHAAATEPGVQDPAQLTGALTLGSSDEPSAEDVAAQDGPEPQSRELDLTALEQSPTKTTSTESQPAARAAESTPTNDLTPPSRPIGRTARRSSLPDAGRRQIHLGSHARRRYGADDWSVPETGRLGGVPTPTPTSPAPKPKPAPEVPAANDPAPSSTAAAGIPAITPDEPANVPSVFEPVAPTTASIARESLGVPLIDAPGDLGDDAPEVDASPLPRRVPPEPQLPVRTRGAAAAFREHTSTERDSDRPTSWMEEDALRGRHAALWRGRPGFASETGEDSSQIGGVGLPPVEPQQREAETHGEPTPRRHGVLVMPDGQQVDVDGPVIIGRAPSQVDDDRPARLVTLNGTGRAISRNHVRFDVGITGPFVVDLGSRNGTRLHRPGEPGVQMDPWLPYPVPIGSVLVVADVMLTFAHEAEVDDEF